MKPLVSLITPVFNLRNFFPFTVQSVVNQTLSNKYFEWIIVDDNSSDRTIEESGIIETRINYNVFLNQNNIGVASSRNLAIENSGGKYISLLDGDDLLEPEALEKALSFMEKNPEIHYSYSRHKRIDQKGNFICDRPGYPFSRERLIHFNYIGPLECFRRDLFDGVGGYDSSYFAEDYDFVLRASEILREDQILQNPDYLYLYRIHDSNKSVKGIEKSRKSASKAIKNSLRRKEKIDVDVLFSHMTKDKYTYFEWRPDKNGKI